MTLTDFVDHLADEARRVMTKVVEQDAGPFQTRIELFRGDEPVVCASLLPDRDSMVQVLDLLWKGFAPTSFTVAFDSYSALVKTDPRTGEVWAAGSMQSAAQYDHGIENGWITDALMVIGGQASGPQVQMRVLPYRMRGGSVEWSDPNRIEWGTGSDGQVGGVVADAFSQILAITDYWPRPEPPVEEGLSEVEAEVIGDVAVLALLDAMAGEEVLLALASAPGSERSKACRKLFGASPYLN